MRIVIDLQGAQGKSRNRGIGRYSLQLAQWIARTNAHHELFLFLNGAYVDTIEPLRSAFEGLIPQENILVWQPPGSVIGEDREAIQIRDVAEKSREAFLAALNPDWVVVTSLFESLAYAEEAVTSIGRFSTLNTAVVLYDLIPLIHKEVYLSNPVVHSWYMEKIQALKRANLLLAISDSAGTEAKDLLEVDSLTVVTIGTDCDVQFRARVLDDNEVAYLRSKYNIRRPFVMYTGGIDHRKNIDGLIRAYSTLPTSTRRSHQLVVVCAIGDSEREQLLSLVSRLGLNTDEVVFTGYVPDEELVALYNCSKIFVFPSRHEGFGLPVLEAMRCGKAVLASGTSSLPEVVGRQDALFDPDNIAEMAARIDRALNDDDWRHELEKHALEYSTKFSWKISAQKAHRALEAAAGRISQEQEHRRLVKGVEKPRLAYVSPMPPEKTGIADFSAGLLPHLAKWYDIDLVVSQDPPQLHVPPGMNVRSVDEFRAGHTRYDRVIYHFGNSTFHSHMFSLLRDIPGVVVLHDFFLSGVLAYDEFHQRMPQEWTSELQRAHGYAAVRERFASSDPSDVIKRYPASLSVIQNALGTVVHSEHARSLALQWFGSSVLEEITVTPLLRIPLAGIDRGQVRRELDLKNDAVLVCAFGMLGPTKLNHQLLEAWLESPLARDPRARLVYVGANDEGAYGQTLLARIRESGAADRITITGWVDAATYQKYLFAADIAVQLRTASRGETSAAVLDCMNAGLPTIVNRHGSMAELDLGAIWMLEDDFEESELVDALTVLSYDTTKRQALGARAQMYVREHHAPEYCAEKYADAIEAFYCARRPKVSLSRLVDEVAKIGLPEDRWPAVARSFALNFPPTPRRRQLLVDVSELVQRDARSGIQRVVRSILQAWLMHPPEGYQVEPVYATQEEAGYRYARRWTSKFLEMPDHWAEDGPVDAWPGDVFVGLDLQPTISMVQESVLQNWRARGVTVWFVVYDLLPLLLPGAFVDGAQPHYFRWLRTVCHFDGVATISRSVMNELWGWLDDFGPKRGRPLSVGWFHLGCDLLGSKPTEGMPPESEHILKRLRARPSFLMVGTLEPRKGHHQVLKGFERLWEDGLEVNLVFVGKYGWKMEHLEGYLRLHPEAGRRFFWLEGVSDEFLDQIYETCCCLIAASEGEGFGLPLIEASKKGMPVIARDIPVFREVAGDHAFYFADEMGARVIAECIRQWLPAWMAGEHPKAEGMACLSWEESAKQLLETILEGARCQRWMPKDGSPALRFWGNDPRMFSSVGVRRGKSIISDGAAGFLLYGPYSAFRRGRYKVLMRGKAQRWASGEWVDVAFNGGQTRLAKVMLRELPVGEWQTALEFYVEEDCNDLEIRVWVEETTHISVEAFAIESVHDVTGKTGVNELPSNEAMIKVNELT